MGELPCLLGGWIFAECSLGGRGKNRPGQIPVRSGRDCADIQTSNDERKHCLMICLVRSSDIEFAIRVSKGHDPGIW